MATDPLREELNKLALALEPHDIELIVGGGFGLVLRTEEIRLNNRRTRFQNPPGVRSTSDIDLFLRAEIVTDNNKMRLIRSTFDDLGYMKVKGAEYYQFVLPIEYAGFPRGIKVDLLAAPVSGPRSAEVKQDVRRIRPRGSFNRLHAHVTPEAFTVEQNTLPVDIGDASKPVTVHIPHPFSYLLLKLFALRDRIDDTEKGAYHAFDIYRTIAMMTSEEWD
ncbi:MAG TPA: hypothetical protein VEZ90_10775, partial [Blastocatellia bacterium]|nr:hypothetical protein [Blastocatellia bacterium]